MIYMIYRWFTTFTLKNSKNGSFSAQPGHKAGLGHLLRTNRVHRGTRRGTRRGNRVRGVGGGRHWRLGTGFFDERSGRLDGITHIYILYIILYIYIYYILYYIYIYMYLILYVVWNILYKYICIIILYTSYKYTIQVTWNVNIPPTPAWRSINNVSKLHGTLTSPPPQRGVASATWASYMER